MEQAFIYFSLALFGAGLGSFAGAQVWRLRARQLVEEKKAGEEVDEAEYKRLLPLTKNKGRKDRSIDLDTGRQLAWYDLIPVVSWLMLRGKSRYSGKPIGYFEILMEVGLAVFFVLLYAFWPNEIDSVAEVGKFGIWLVAGVIFAIQFGTDFKWKILWTALNYLLIGLGVVYTLIVALDTGEYTATIGSSLGAVAVLGGLYFMLYAISQERWVGLGDVYLGVALGLLLADWQLALVALFLANLIGSLVVLPGLMLGRLSRKAQVPFGPLLIVGATIAMLVGEQMIDWYIGLLL